jgi:ankyrin repeat protein
MQDKHGATALMYAAERSCLDSTEETVAQLLAHESSSQVMRLQDRHGYTALMLAVRYSASDSSDATVAQLLAHESSMEVAKMRSNRGITALMWAVTKARTDVTIARLLAHESIADVLFQCCDRSKSALDIAQINGGRVSETTIELLVKTMCRLGSASDLELLCVNHPKHTANYLLDLRQRTAERETTSTAFKAGLSLPTSIVLTYL